MEVVAEFKYIKLDYSVWRGYGKGRRGSFRGGKEDYEKVEIPKRIKDKIKVCSKPS